jgi:hypothetical protein
MAMVATGAGLAAWLRGLGACQRAVGPRWCLQPRFEYYVSQAWVPRDREAGRSGSLTLASRNRWSSSRRRTRTRTRQSSHCFEELMAAATLQGVSRQV